MRSLLLAALLFAGCGDGGGLPGLGRSCSVLCATGLTCSSSKVCVKSCRCDGGASCMPTSLATGCPVDSACVVEQASGLGSCAVVCDGRACPPGEGSCAVAPEGTPLCVGPDYPWVGLDAGVTD